MKLTTIVFPLAMNLLTGVHAWANDESGKAIANMRLHEMDGKMVAEACTVQNTNQIRETGECEYWAYGGKEIVHGECWKWEAPPGSDKKTTIDCLKNMD